MRGDLASGGSYRVSIEYQQRASTAPVTEARHGEPGIFSKQQLSAQLDYRDEQLRTVTMTLSSNSSAPRRSFVIKRAGDDFAYSLDEIAWGRLRNRPTIFDLADFQSRLDDIQAGDISIEQAMEARRLRESLEIEVPGEEFKKLLAVFNPDADQDEDLDMTSHAVTVAGGDELSLLYWWTLSGLEVEQGPLDQPAKNYAVKITCSVSIKLESAAVGDAAENFPETSLPELGELDDIWKLLRRQPAEAE